MPSNGRQDRPILVGSDRCEPKTGQGEATAKNKANSNEKLSGRFEGLSGRQPPDRGPQGEGHEPNAKEQKIVPAIRAMTFCIVSISSEV